MDSTKEKQKGLPTGSPLRLARINPLVRQSQLCS